MSARRLNEKKVEVQDLPPIGHKERNTSFTRGPSIERGGRSGRLPVVVLETWPCWFIDSDGEVACRHRHFVHIHTEIVGTFLWARRSPIIVVGSSRLILTVEDVSRGGRREPDQG